jgi:hypothetical protein
MKPNGFSPYHHRYDAISKQDADEAAILLNFGFDRSPCLESVSFLIALPNRAPIEIQLDGDHLRLYRWNPGNHRTRRHDLHARHALRRQWRMVGLCAGRLWGDHHSADSRHARPGLVPDRWQCGRERSRRLQRRRNGVLLLWNGGRRRNGSARVPVRHRRPHPRCRWRRWRLWELPYCRWQRRLPKRCSGSNLCRYLYRRGRGDADLGRIPRKLLLQQQRLLLSGRGQLPIRRNQLRQRRRGWVLRRRRRVGCRRRRRVQLFPVYG